MARQESAWEEPPSASWARISTIPLIRIGLALVSGSTLVVVSIALLASPSPVSAQGSHTYTITLPEGTFVVMGDQTAILPFTVANEVSSTDNIDSVQIGLDAAVYWVSTATMAPDGWKVTEIKNAGAGQAWVHFEAITTTNAIEPGEDLTFDVIVVGNQFGVFPSSDQDETDTLDFVRVEGTVDFDRAGPLPEWERRALAVTLLASPSSLAQGGLVDLTMNVFNRSTITQTSVVPTTTVASGSGGVSLATGPTPAERSIPPGAAASFTWTYTATSSGDVVFRNSASNAVACSPSAQSNTVLIGDFTAALDLEPSQIISGQLTTVNMTVKNNSTSTITDVTPSQLGRLGAATMTLRSGPSPATVSSLGPGAAASFEWVYTATGDIGATYQFTGTASTGGGVTSNVGTSPEGAIKRYTVSVTPRFAAVGALTTTFRYVVANNGGLPVRLVEFTLPSDFTYNAGNASGGYSGDWDITKDGAQNPKIIRFEAAQIPTDTLPVGSLATFTITFSALPSSATDYFFPVRIVDTGDAERTENVAVTITDYEVTLMASPCSGIPADGVSISVITASVTFSGSVASGQTVQFHATKGVLSSETGVTDASGVATTSLTSPASTQETSAIVTAWCSAAQDQVVVTYVGSYNLTVETVGNGFVAVGPDQAGYAAGTVVTLTATADPGWSFSDWSGDLTSTANPLTLTVDANKALTATFSQDEYLLTVTIVGSGTVAADPAKSTYQYGDVVTLTATADPGWSFSDWSGDLTSTANPLTLTVDASKALTATFSQDAYTLTLTIVGSGTVDADPAKSTYQYGDVVTLTATADADWSFAGWSGDLTSTTNPISLTLDSSKTIVATFQESGVSPEEYWVYLPMVLSNY